MRWTTGTGSNEFYAYDASGNRVLRRSTSGGTTTMTVYAFGLEEHLYSGNGTSQGSTYYYSLAGRLIGELTRSTKLRYLSEAKTRLVELQGDLPCEHRAM